MVHTDVYGLLKYWHGAMDTLHGVFEIQTAKEKFACLTNL